MEAPGFWDNPDYSNKKMKELKNLKDTVWKPSMRTSRP